MSGARLLERIITDSNNPDKLRWKNVKIFNKLRSEGINQHYINSLHNKRTTKYLEFLSKNYFFYFPLVTKGKISGKFLCNTAKARGACSKSIILKMKQFSCLF